MGRLSRTIFYLASFGLARGGLFVAPIVLANLLAPADYGALELAQALASIGATVLALGTSAAVPLVLVRKVTTASWGGVLLHQAGSVALLVGLALAAVMAGAPPVIWLTALCTGTLMLQGLWSVTLKSQGRGEASLLMDAGFWGVVTLAAMVAYGLMIPTIQRATWALGALVAYLAALACWTVWRLAEAAPDSASRMYAPTVRTGLPLMAVTLLALLATTSGRLGIGLLSTPEITADYAVLFRATALPIVAHQVIMVARFRQIFELPTLELERRLPVVVGLVGASAVVFWLLSGVAGGVLGPAFVSAFTRHRTEGLVILSQCILWSAIALNDLVNTRSQSAGMVARGSALYFVLVLPLAWWFLSSRQVTLSLFVPVHSAVMAGYFLTQAMVMWRCGIKLVRTWGLTLGGFLALSALAQVI
jgi:O-antigen/teichoic acid export membrane protein